MSNTNITAYTIEQVNKHDKEDDQRLQFSTGVNTDYNHKTSTGVYYYKTVGTGVSDYLIMKPEYLYAFFKVTVQTRRNSIPYYY